MHRIDPRQADALDASRLWWLLALSGVVGVALGVVLIARPSHSLNTLAVIFGAFLLVDGIVALIVSIRDEENRALGVIMALLAIVIGIVLIRHPIHGVKAIGLLVGIWLVADGALGFFRAIVEGVHPLLRSFIAWIEMSVGCVIVADPHIGYTALAVIAGIWLVVSGFGTIALALTLRRQESDLAAAR